MILTSNHQDKVNKYCKEKMIVNMDNLEGVYKTPLKSLVVSKPNSGSTIGGQVNVDYLQFAKFLFFVFGGILNKHKG